MSQDAVIRLLQTNAKFAVNFIVDNNYEGVAGILASKGVVIPNNVVLKDFVQGYLLNMLNTNKAGLIALVEEIPYNNTDTAADYTKGFNDYFMRTMPARTVTSQGKFTLEALFGGLGTGLSTYAGIAGAADASGANPVSAVDAAQAQAQADADAKRRNTWIIIGTLAGVIVLGVVIYFTTRKKKE